MATPLSSLRLGAQDILHAIAESPDDEQLRQIAPDEIEFEGYSHLAAVMREDSRAALYIALHGSVPDESQCAKILRHSGTISQHISQALWTAERPPIPDLRTVEGVKAQYDAQRILLASGGLPVPDCFKDVQKHLKKPAVREYLENGPRLLLLVPRRPFAEYMTALEGWLCENVHLLHLPAGRALPAEPVSCADTYKDGLEYHCPGGWKDGWRTFIWKSEEQWLCEKQADIVVAEPVADVYADRDRSAEQAWSTRRPGEVFLTPQSWAMFFRTLLERGVVLDTETWSILAGARFAADTSVFRGVPDALWLPRDRQACFGWGTPDFADESSGARGSR